MRNITTLDSIKKNYVENDQEDRVETVREQLKHLPPARSDELQIFWEYQGNDRMCALHALNALLQGPVFDEHMLSSIALKLDERERALLDKVNQTDTKETADLLKGRSINVSDDGFFSFPVIEEALKTYGVSCVPIGQSYSYGTQNLLYEDGFLIHFSEHWIPLRRFVNKWYNLDSLQKNPVYMPDAYLTRLLEQLIYDSKYVIFVIRDLPTAQRSGYLKCNQVYLSPSQIEYLQQKNKVKPLVSFDGLTVEDYVEAEQPHRVPEAPREQELEENSLNSVFLESMKELQKSRPSPPPEPDANDPECIHIQVRLLDGSVSARRFCKSHDIECIFHWIEKSLPLPNLKFHDVYSLISCYPKREFIRYSPTSGVSLVNESSNEEDVSRAALSQYFTSKYEQLVMRLIISQEL